MELNSDVYLLFLGVVALVQAALPARNSWRLFLLLGASFAFYACSSVANLALLLAVCGANAAGVRYLSRAADGLARTMVYALVLGLDLVVLLAFKYFTGFLTDLLVHFGWLHGTLETPVHVATPLGISYFTFQMLACLIDCYRRDWEFDGSWTQFFTFGLFFPQISSGPIPRAGRLLPQLVLTAPTAEDRLVGLRLLAFGMFKKFVVANRLVEYVDSTFTTDLPVSTLPMLISCVFNTLQLYADFSGYVDIAIGSARLLGVKLDPNFDRPFVSTSVTEFWRRWHMSLSFWLRDYLFMPIYVATRDWGRAGMVFALLFTFGICGIWHGANWTFVIFGLLQGVAMSGEVLTQKWRNRRLKGTPMAWQKWAGWAYTMFYFAMTEVVFRAKSLDEAGRAYAHLFTPMLPHSAAEFFAYKGALYLTLDVVAIGIWYVLSTFLYKAIFSGTHYFLFVTVLLILTLGRLSTGHFIYVAF